MANSTPCDFHPNLKVEYVQFIANLIRNARNEAAHEFNADRGDTPWITGCKGFNWAWQRLLKVAGTQGYEWLTVIDPSMHCVCAIGGVPFRFYKGTADKPTARTLKQTFNELNQFSLSFDAPDNVEEILFRFAVETDVDGFVDRVIFAALQSNGIVVSSMEVHSAEQVVVLSTTDKPQAQGVDMPAPSMNVKQEKRKKSGNGDVS